MTIHTFPGAAPARRVLSGNTASEEQRRAACETIESRKLTDEEVAVMMNDQYGYRIPPVASVKPQFPAPESDTRPVIGWLLIAVVIGAALAVWVLV